MDIAMLKNITCADDQRVEIMGRRMICEQYVFCVFPNPQILFANAPSDAKLFIDAQWHEEIIAHLEAYSQKALVFEDNGRAIAILPTFYPSSSLGVALRFEIGVSELLRLAAACDFSNLFCVSQRTQIRPVRLSTRLGGMVDDFLTFFKALSGCFFAFDEFLLCLSSTERLDKIKELCLGVSRFLGCPLSLGTIDCELPEDAFEQTDLPLLTAFLVSMLILVRRNAEDRSACICLEPTRSSLIMSVKMKAAREICAEAGLLKWKYIAYDKNMLFDVWAEGEYVTVRFDPCRAEWSLLGLKQCFGTDIEKEE